MSQILLQKDNISIIWEINELRSFSSETWKWQAIYSIRLTFNILVNGKLKVWGTHYSLQKENGDFWLKDYHAWNDTKDLLCSLWYPLEEENIKNYIDQFQIETCKS